MVSLGQQGGPLGKWGLRFRLGDSISEMDRAIPQVKVAAIMDRIGFRWRRFEEGIGEEKDRQRSR